MVKSHNITISYKELSSTEELSEEDRILLKEAIDTATNAYAPYSGFRVGAALRMESGKTVKGANVENAAFPSGICAERTAISSFVSNFPNDKPDAIAIAALNENGLTDEPVTPCGNCRQVIAEEEVRSNSRIRLILGGSKKIYVIESINSLLPLQFSKSNLR